VMRISPPNSAKITALRSRMTLLFMVACAAILLMTAVSLFLANESRIGGASYTTINNSKGCLENFALFTSDLHQIIAEVQNQLAEADQGGSVKSAAAIKALSSDIDQRLAAALELIEQPEERDLINKTFSTWMEYRKTLLEEVVPASGRGDVLKARTLMTGIQTQRLASITKTVTALAADLRRTVTAAEDRVSSEIRVIMILSSLAAILAIGVVALLAYALTRSVTRPLGNCAEFVNTVADGRLDARLDVSGPAEVAALAGAINNMTENLQRRISRISSVSETLASIENNIEKTTRHVAHSARLQESAVGQSVPAIENIRDVVENVAGNIEKLATSATESASSTLEMAATIEEIAMSADKLGDSFDEVSSSITEMAVSIKEIGSSIVNLLDASAETSSSIAQMDATIKQVEKNALDAATITEGVKHDAETGKRAVEEAITGMQAIRNSSQIAAEVIENLSLRANDIGAILSVIDEVAEQTNLLALNATIIAAQAGEYGKGFAVVADEIRELSERTSSSTREIAAVIRGVQEETGRAVDAINNAEASIADGEKLAHHSGAALVKIVSGVQQASMQVNRIARTTLEQAHGSQIIKEAMESVAEMVEHIANSAAEHTQTSELIARAMERMKDMAIQVRCSTHEQSQTSGLIADSTRDVLDSIEQIRKSGCSQDLGSDAIAAALKNIQVSTAGNTETVRSLESSFDGLSRQVNLLEKELSDFKI
jgi:methyl-accepting chemotaxis protein